MQKRSYLTETVPSNDLFYPLCRIVLACEDSPRKLFRTATFCLDRQRTMILGVGLFLLSPSGARFRKKKLYWELYCKLYWDSLHHWLGNLGKMSSWHMLQNPNGISIQFCSSARASCGRGHKHLLLEMDSFDKSYALLSRRLGWWFTVATSTCSCQEDPGLRLPVLKIIPNFTSLPPRCLHACSRSPSSLSFL